MDLKTRYVLKGLGKETTISSKINIFYDKDTGKITKVEDKWDGQLPDSSFANVSIGQLISPWWWVHYYEGWAWWMWSFTWQTRPWQVGVCMLRAESTMVTVLYCLESFTNVRACVYVGFPPAQLGYCTYNGQRSKGTLALTWSSSLLSFRTSFFSVTRRIGTMTTQISLLNP